MHRYSKLGYVALNVTDLARSRHFYEAVWGLQFNESGPNGELFFRCSDDHHNVVLHSGTRPGLKRIGWELESESDLEKLAEALGRTGIEVREVDAEERAVLRQGRSIRFVDPFTGVLHECYGEMHNLGGKPWVPTLARIQRLGHVVLAITRYAEAVKFYQEVLNFRVSDSVDNLLSFMRCFPNPFHHSLGLANTGRRGLHHVNFMVSEIDDLGKALSRFKKNDVTIVYGPGRHPPSGSIFLYALDPDGITVEYSYGMEEFPELNARKPRLLPPLRESLDFWDSSMDPKFGAIGEIELELPEQQKHFERV